MEQTMRRNRLAKQLHQLVFAGALSFLLTSIATAAFDDNDAVPSRPDDWIQAGTSTSDNWSHEALLNQILGRSKVETREQVIALLGPPNYTLDLYSAGYGFTDRFDTYRLSAKNDRSYSITYKPSGEIQHQEIENWPCGYPDCEKAAKVASAALRPQSVSDFLASLKGAPSVPQMLSTIKFSVGNPGVKKIDLGVRRGGQSWAFYLVIWPIAGDDHRFFMASGSMPMVNYSRDKDLPIDSYSLIAVTNECLGRGGDEIPNLFAPR
jgi:hypothetical protein